METNSSGRRILYLQLEINSSQKMCLSVIIRSFEKGLADRRGCREEFLPVPEIEVSFLHPFSHPPLGEGGHISGERFFAVFWGLFVANPLPPTPFSKPLKSIWILLLCLLSRRIL